MKFHTVIVSSQRKRKIFIGPALKPNSNVYNYQR
jgi:hypothetical protein